MFDTILNTLNTLGSALPDWVAAITGVVAAATAITMLTPTKTDDKIVNGLLSVLNFLAGNVFKNKNKDDV